MPQVGYQVLRQLLRGRPIRLANASAQLRAALANGDPIINPIYDQHLNSQGMQIVARVIATQEDAVARFRGGNEGSLGFLVGQVMAATRGRANPKMAHKLLRRALTDC